MGVMVEPRAAVLAAGVVIDRRYEILRPLGAGGMGEVYAARRLAIGDEVALKRLLPEQDSPASRRRFATEAQAAAHIRHPNVIQVFDYGEDPHAGPYLVMEKLDGPTLADALAAGPLPPARAAWLFAAMCAAVEAGHRRGIVHRDLKPANVMIAATDDGRELVKVLDFGLAVDLRLTASDPTPPGQLVGTIAYMAPEQAEGASASPRSDVYALGVILYEMVTGARPFQAPTPGELLLAIHGGHYRPPHELVPDLPRGLAAAIARALVRNPDERPASPERLAQLAVEGLDLRPPAPATADAAVTAAASPAGALDSAARTARTARPGRDDTPTLASDDDDALPGYGRFVGRRHELDALRAAYDDALAGRAPVVLVSADPGLGASRLVERFAVDARERGALTLPGRFFAYAGSRPPPLETFLAMLGRGAAGEAAAAHARARLDRDATGASWNAFAAIADALSGQAAGRPLVLLLHDLQWASRADLELIDHLRRNLGPRALLTVATVHTGAGASGGDELTAWRARQRDGLRELALAPFGEDEVEAWLGAAFRGIRLGAIELRRLWRATGGSPLALVEIARHLVARRTLVRDGGGWRIDGNLEPIEPPGSVAAIVTARLGELAPAHRALLEAAAVIGDEFRIATLAAVTGADERAIDDAVDAGLTVRLLSERGVSAGNDCRFRDALTRQVTYDELAPRARRRLHREVAQALTRIYGDHDDRFAHVFAYHHHAVGAWRDALGFGLRATREALARGDYEQAQAALGHADDAHAQLAAAGMRPDGEVSARLDHLGGAVATALGELEGGARRLGRALATAGPGLAVEVRTELARNLGARGELVAAVREAERAAAEAGALADPERALAARVLLVSLGGRAGLVPPAWLDALIAEAETAPPALRGRAHGARGWRRLKAGDFAGAEADALTARDLARAAGDLEGEVTAVSTLAATRQESGDVAAATAGFEECVAMARRLGDRRREAISLANLGEAWVERGEARRAHDQFQAALQIFVDIGDRACEGDCRVNVGRALLALGRDDEALAMLRRAAELCLATSRVEYEGLAHVLLGEAHERRGDLATARAHLTRAVALFEPSDLHHRWRAELGLARILTALAEVDGARVHADRARAHLIRLRERLAPGTDPRALDAALAEAVGLLVPA